MRSNGIRLTRTAAQACPDPARRGAAVWMDPDGFTGDGPGDPDGADGAGRGST
jgi:hypothetical protein